MFVYGKENYLEPSFFTFSTHAIVLWVGQVKCRYQNMATLEWTLSKKTMENIVLQFKVFTKPKPLPFRIYVIFPIGDTYYINGTGQCRTRVC